jgi:NACHT domain
MEVLKYIYDWVNDMESEQNILWVHGLAGSGKSTLSTTIANTYSDSGQLGAFVFFSRDDTERSGPTTFVRTLAHQIGSFNQRIGAAIRAVLESNSNILMYPLPRQFQRLVLDPLLEVEAPFPRIVIVLDALDECGTADEREILLTVLSQDFANLPSTIRTIVMSRAENDIHIAFDSQHHIRPYQLDITSTGNAVDILTYFRHRMAFIRTKNRHLRLGTDWPGEEIFLQLVQRASGLFVWASTAVEFINGHAPKRRLDSILKGDASSGAEAALDTLYMTALDSAGLWDDEDFVVEFRSILGIILTARQPLSSSALDALLNLPEDRPSIHTISLLRCVLQHHPNVRVLHPSFADFLMNKDRCNRDIWHFDPSVYHRILAFRCLDRMDAVLRRNMCNMTLTVDGAIESLPEDVSYSCMFWVDHVCIIDDDVRPVVDRLHGFLFRHLIHWFEAMSILHRARDTIPLLEILIDWLSVSIL